MRDAICVDPTMLEVKEERNSPEHEPLIDNSNDMTDQLFRMLVEEQDSNLEVPESPPLTPPNDISPPLSPSGLTSCSSTRKQIPTTAVITLTQVDATTTNATNVKRIRRVIPQQSFAKQSANKVVSPTHSVVYGELFAHSAS